MAYINLPEGSSGFQDLLRARPATGNLLERLSETVLASNNGLSRGERELIAAYVSLRNNSPDHYAAHRAAAEELLPHKEMAERLFEGKKPDPSHLSSKMRALFALVEKVRFDASSVAAEDLEAARKAGASDELLHDVVLLVSTVCLLNKYADGLGAKSLNSDAENTAASLDHKAAEA